MPDEGHEMQPPDEPSPPAAMVGFIGVGVMGEPMATHLARAHVPLIVWSRRRERLGAVESAGARAAGSIDELCRASHTLILMLVDARATDDVLGRGTPAFAGRVRGRLVINMATVPPAYSASLEADVRAMGGRYVEAPVSGQRPIAEAAALVAMVAGRPEAVNEAVRLLRPMCRNIVPCGAVPGGLAMKLAVNLVSGATMTVLAEGVHYARRQGLDPALFASVLNETSLGSEFLRMKLPKLVQGDFAVQGAIGVGRKDFDMMRDAAATSGASIPLLELCSELWDEAIALGHGREDVSVVLRALEARADASERLVCRLAVPDDVPGINALAARSIRALHAGSYDEATIEEAVEHAYGVDWQLVRDGTYLVVEIAGVVVGAGGWSHRETIAGAHGPDGEAAPCLDPARDAARIRAFYVDPTRARHGIGRLLLSTSEAAASRAGFTSAELTSTLPAVPFYAASGYQAAGAFDLALPSGSRLRLETMRKRLD